MLTRLYIDNFRCLVKFEFRPARKQLIFGANGSGKSSVLDALLFLRQFAAKGDRPEDHRILGQATRWLGQRDQSFELEATLDERPYQYRVVLEPSDEPIRPKVRVETVHCEGTPIFEFIDGEVHLYNDRFERKVSYPFDPYRSALATVVQNRENKTLTAFQSWFSSLYCFRLNPFAMRPTAEREDLFPTVDLSNYASWYRHLVQSDQRRNQDLLKSLRKSLDSLSFLTLQPYSENVRILVAEFDRMEGGIVKFGFGELSEGQRCLICLYTILHFAVAKGSSVILDEPDNFLSLREIQPWLMALADLVEDGQGQALLISHHPELINQWAPESGVQLKRDRAGAVRAEPFRGDPESSLSPAELVARGWENG